MIDGMSSTLRAARLCLALMTGACLLTACGDDDNGAPGSTNTGQACTAVDQCYPGVADGALLGAAECLDKVEGGYCTHACTQDSDCCAATGECPNDYAQVCSPFSSTDDQYCFLSCEKQDVDHSDALDEEDYCQRFASAAFHCRSSGGGSANRKVCVP